MRSTVVARRDSLLASRRYDRSANSSASGAICHAGARLPHYTEPQTLDESCRCERLLDTAVQAPTAMHTGPWGVRHRAGTSDIEAHFGPCERKLGQRGGPLSRSAHGRRRQSDNRVRLTIREPGFLCLLRRQHLDRHLRQAAGTIRRCGLLVGRRKPDARRVRAGPRHVLHRIGGSRAEQPGHEIRAGNSVRRRGHRTDHRGLCRPSQLRRSVSKRPESPNPGREANEADLSVS